MTRHHTILLLIVAVILASAAGYGLYGYFFPQAENPPMPAATHGPLPEHRPDFSLPDPAGKRHNISEWDGKALVVNFWATWCPPCRREIPLLDELQKQYGDQGVQIIGIAVDERGAVQDYQKEMHFDYPVLVGQEDAEKVAAGFGIDQLYGLPMSVLVDRDGKVLAIHTGELTEDDAPDFLAPVLHNGSGSSAK